jgi:hypothetical protein
LEIEDLRVTANDPPLYKVRVAFEVNSPWNVWARENNPAGQLQARWMDSAGRLSVCHSNLADRSKVWVERTGATR